MSYEKEIKAKLVKEACAVDKFIYQLLKDRKPVVLYQASRHLIKAGGKRLRPYLTLKACEAVGGNKADAIPFAAALEVLHNFTLVHDDIMDNDSKRRGNPTVHTEYGTSVAICAGDLLFAKVYDSMIRYAPKDMPAEIILTCVENATTATILICEGQTLDVLFPESQEVSEEDYIFMVEGKTSALFKACSEIGAIVGRGTDEQVKALGRFAWDAGIAFQIVDDILGIMADEETLGKPVGSDLREGKQTLIIIHALRTGSPEQKAVLMKVLGVDDASVEDIEAAKHVLQKIGSIKYAHQKANEYTKNALKMLDIVPDSEAKSDLRALIGYFVDRKY